METDQKRAERFVSALIGKHETATVQRWMLLEMVINVLQDKRENVT